MKFIISVFVLIASFSAFSEDMSGDWDPWGNPVQHPDTKPQPIYPHPQGE